MNRIQRWPPQAQQAEDLARVEQSLIKPSGHQGLPHALFAPLHYEPNYAYPLIVWLHGPRDDERQLIRVMPLVSMRNYVAVGPRASFACEDLQHGFYWGSSDEAMSLAEQRVFDCIDAAQHKFHIASQRVFLAGFLCGGTMAFRIGLKHPERFGGVLSVGGPFPTGQTPLQRLNQARHLPVFIAHGRSASLYSIDRACEELRLFHVAGMSVTLRQYPCGDELDSQMLHDMNVWMMEQVTGVDQSSDTAPSRWHPGESN